MTRPTQEVDAARWSAVSGSMWTGLAFVINKSVALASAVVLARLLEPEQYGLAAIGLLVAAFAEVLGEGGLGSAVVYVRGADKPIVRNALSLAMITGMAATLLGLLTAPALADAFDAPDAEPILMVLASVYMISSLRHVYAGALARQLLFKKRIIPDTVRALVKATVTIVLAAMGFGPWAIVWGQLAGTAADLLTFIAVTGRRLFPGRLQRVVAEPLVRFGSPLIVVGLIGVILQNADYVMVGARAGAEDLGVYSLAFKVPELTLLALPFITGQALFPIFVRLDAGDDDATGFRQGVLAAVRAIAAIAAPVAVVLSVFAPQIVEGVFGEKWAAAGPVLRALALYGLLFALSFTLGDGIKAKGEAGLLAKLGVLRMGIGLPVLWWAAGHGIEWVAWAQVALAGLLLAVTTALAVAKLQIGVGALAGAYAVPALGGAAAAVVAILLQLVGGDWPPLLTVLTGGLLSLAAYVLVTWWTDRDWVRSLRTLRST
jgi:lipopolysaccharide exporter